GVLVVMAVLPGHRLELWLSLGLTAVLVGVGVLRQRRPRGGPASSVREPEGAARHTVGGR
ncbi:hypothetical protein, partial [Nocardia asteroides]